MTQNGMTQNNNINRFMVYVFDNGISVVDYTSESRLVKYGKKFDERYNMYYMDDITKDKFAFRVVIGVDEATVIDRMADVMECELFDWTWENRTVYGTLEITPLAWVATKGCVLGFMKKIGLL